MKRTRNVIILVAALAAVVVFALFSSHRGGDAPAQVKMQHVRYQAFTVKLPENGVVQRPATVTVPTLVAGNIGTIYVKAGDRVSAGEVLATIDNPTLEYNAAGAKADYTNSVANVATARVDERNAKVQYQGQVETQRSALAEARRIYNADAQLLKQRAIARTTVDADKAKLDQAQVAYDQALEQLKLGAVSGYGVNSVQAAQAAAEKAQIVNSQNQQQLALTRITAPFAGVVQTVAAQANDPLRALEPGDPVTAGQALFTLASGQGYIVKAQVDEQDIINVKVGQRANVTGQDFPGKTITGHVARIAPVAEKSTDASSTARQVVTTIALDTSPDFLRDGMSADIDILTTDIPHALTVPNAAVGKDGKTSYVFVVKNGVAKKRTVKLGQANDSVTLVDAGVVPGDAIVASLPTPALKDGAKVTPLPSASPSTSP
ncbi:MAG: efflux RND transporter periplasmic adaptor subunit [Candidatus Eremiobacteraeota bacterium]|nr:efflux RND transporter periplasmic adaptor subunit [Candidatus Eremiobacteraeota bacterium]